MKWTTTNIAIAAISVAVTVVIVILLFNSSESCIILDSGQKLCGVDAQVWCQNFANPTDEETIDACREFGEY